MDGKDPKIAKQKNHGLRLIKGASPESTQRVLDEITGPKKETSQKGTNPLVKQLTALADAIDADIQRILKS